MELASPQKDQPTLLLLPGIPKCALFSGQGVCEQHGSLSFGNLPWMASPSLQGMSTTEWLPLDVRGNWNRMVSWGYIINSISLSWMLHNHDVIKEIYLDSGNKGSGRGACLESRSRCCCVWGLHSHGEWHWDGLGLSVAVGWSHWAVLCKAPGEIVLATNSSLGLTFAVLQTQKRFSETGPSESFKQHRQQNNVCHLPAMCVGYKRSLISDFEVVHFPRLTKNDG